MLELLERGEREGKGGPGDGEGDVVDGGVFGCGGGIGVDGVREGDGGLGVEVWGEVLVDVGDEDDVAAEYLLFRHHH